MVVSMGDEEGDQGGLPGPLPHVQCATRQPDTPRTRHLQPYAPSCADGDEHRVTTDMNRPRGLLGPCARERACAVLRGPRCSNAPGLPGDIPWPQLEATLSGRPLPPVVDPLAVTGDGGDSPAWSRKRGVYEAPALVRGTSTADYAELHCHTNFSFLDGASHPEELVEEAYQLGLTGLAVTDHDGFYGVVRFSEAARELDLPTVFGAELSLGLRGPQNGVPDPAGRHL